MPYSPEAVNAAIASSNRHGRHIGKREATAIHRLLAGRTPRPPMTREEFESVCTPRPPMTKEEFESVVAPSGNTK
jgi:hypothetical protein